jgi:hypothetical protein
LGCAAVIDVRKSGSEKLIGAGADYSIHTHTNIYSAMKDGRRRSTTVHLRPLLILFVLLQAPRGVAAVNIFKWLFDFLYPEIIKVEVSVVIDRPIDQVFAFCLDFLNDVKWRTDVIEIECLEFCPPLPVQVGSRYTETTNLGTIIPFLPTITISPVVTVFDRDGYRIRWDGTDRDYSVERTFASVGGADGAAAKTKVTALHISTRKETYRLIVVPIPIPIIQLIYSKGRNEELQSLKRYLETTTTEEI